jgi:hypothetical protein
MRKKYLILICVMFLLINTLLVSSFMDFDNWFEAISQTTAHSSGDGKAYIPNATVHQDFVVGGCGEGTIRDTLNELCWQQNVSVDGRNWTNSIEYCEVTVNSTLDGDGWRLPSMNEMLYSLVKNNLGEGDNVITTLHNLGFNNFTANIIYWSRDDMHNDATRAWYTTMSTGYSYQQTKVQTYRSVCVRDYVPPPPPSIEFIAPTPELYAGDFYPLGLNGSFFRGAVSVRSNVSDLGGGVNTSSCGVSVNGGSWTSAGVDYSDGYCVYDDFIPEENFTIKFRVANDYGVFNESLISYFFRDPYLPSREYCFYADDKSDCWKYYVVGACGNGTGTVLDTITGLCFTQDFTAQGTASWTNAIAHCEALDLGGLSNWYLPTVQEFLRVVDYGPGAYRFVVGGNGLIFTNVVNMGYWTSSMRSASVAWRLGLYSGVGGFASLSDSGSRVVCVSRG